MAHIEIWYSCICGACYDTQREANLCALSHVKAERWAVGKNRKAVRIFDNWSPDSIHGVRGALREADLSDFIEVRKKQLEALQKFTVINSETE